MSSGAIAQLMGFITVPDFKKLDNDNSLLKFRLAFNRFDFSSSKNLSNFVTVTAFGKIADRIHSDIKNNLNYVCCFCDVRTNKYNSKSGTLVEHTEFIVNDYRAFVKSKAENPEQDDSNKVFFKKDSSASSPDEGNKPTMRPWNHKDAKNIDDIHY